MKRNAFCLFLTLLLLLSAVASAENGFLPTREYQGKTYQARPASSVTTMLLIGYDHKDFGELDIIPEDYIRGGQSDFLLLLVFDHDSKTIRQLQFNRDTITDVRYYSREGAYRGLRQLQLCLSHAYGDTQELNNKNAIWAVENLLGISSEGDGAQVDCYMSMDISGIARLNDLLGGVTVPIEHDYSYYDPTMTPGKTMTLQGEQAEYYCRQRYYIGDSSNLCRMQRQRVYMNAAAQQLKGMLKQDISFANELLNGMGIIFDTSKDLDAGFGFTTTDKRGTPVTDTPTHYLMTNKSMNALVNLLAQVMDYHIADIEVLPGQSAVSEKTGYMEHHLEEDAGLKWALDALYTLAD